MLKEHAVIFDLDGTLLNTLDDLTASVNAAMKAAVQIGRASCRERV